ncbi:MAG: DUF2970 domain-containing protein [Burkholderiaceae bacterium]
MSADLQDAARRKGSFIGTLRAIGWAFFGVRGGRAHERDLSSLNPIHVIIIGLAAALLFVFGLIAIAIWAVG